MTAHRDRETARAVRLTPAQRRGLVLLATPGAEARTVVRGLRWRVLVGDREIGTIHAETLFWLRCAGLVDWRSGGEHPLDVRQSINAAGRAFVDGRRA